ncbi:hypothetical protein BS50DRAFT_248466 [Corynespora cassiicola Philippines]|uniref:Uncharacterized protein n=1 Tax=Corynespora cassiicola Philippines TaxID=1448308 RepID=A0A2T2P3S1_CORCC|nr:hypothetical protein BS50DRAFT_248466 [Corynespora cassiicola Philippines]
MINPEWTRARLLLFFGAGRTTCCKMSEACQAPCPQATEDWGTKKARDVTMVINQTRYKSSMGRLASVQASGGEAAM